MQIATCEAAANIAVVKYWGKRDDHLILPTNNSLSFTMDHRLATRTTVAFSPKFSKDEFWLNGARANLDEKNKAYLTPLETIRDRAKITDNMRIVSVNRFPTAAGFASSASGVAALVCAGSAAAKLKLSEKELSILARQGSGSAARSVIGGFVEWHKGNAADGSDSYACAIADADHWPELRNIIAVVDAAPKKISSRAAMKRTVATSSLFQKRLQDLPATIGRVKKTVLDKNFGEFAVEIMKESNNMHAVMLDSWPPVIYLNENSLRIIEAVSELCREDGSPMAGYTFDAGANAHVYTLEQYSDQVIDVLKKIDGVKNVITCRVGSGPQILENPDYFLIDPESGEPRLGEIS